VLIGPRTHEQLDGLLSGADIELSGDILDRIDEIVPPGTDLNPRTITRPHRPRSNTRVSDAGG